MWPSSRLTKTGVSGVRESIQSRGGIAQLHPGELEATLDEVGVGIDEAGHDAPTLEVNTPGRRAHEPLDLLIRTDGQNAPVPYRNRGCLRSCDR
jgi:hypothetical protein